MTSRPRRVSKSFLIGKLTVEAMWELWPYYPAQCLPQYDYIAIQRGAEPGCDCATLSHRRKDCVLRGQSNCTGCGVYFPDDGGYPPYCDGCWAYRKMREDYLAEWVSINHPEVMGAGFYQASFI